MKNKALLVLGQFCDNEYDVKLTASAINITHHYDTSMSLNGSQDLSNGMWTISIAPQALPQEQIPTPVANNVYELNKKRDIVTYLHKAAFSPVPSTWIDAIDTGFFTTWPGLKADLVKKHLQKL